MASPKNNEEDDSSSFPLPIDLLLEIVSYLSVGDISSLRRVRVFSISQTFLKLTYLFLTDQQNTLGHHSLEGRLVSLTAHTGTRKMSTDPRTRRPVPWHSVCRPA